MTRTRILLLVALAAVGLAALPLVATAITNPDLIAIYKESIDGLVKLTKLVYCSTGVSALC